jgi:hypothetical protein
MKKYTNKGVISGWNKVEADETLNIRENIDKATEIEDILEIIRSIQIKVGSIDGVSDVLSQHIADENNPHNINILIEDIDIYEVLYAAYVARYGADITQVEFNDAFNFIRRFTTEYDVDNNTNLTTTLNLHIANYLINKHDTDPDAHLNLKQRWFPGLPIISPPSLSIEPVFELEFDSTRSTALNVFDVYGNIKTISPNKLSTSYVNGIPTLPIFDQRTNLIPNSKKPIVTLSNCIDSNTPVNISTPNLDSNMLIVEETNTDSEEVSIEINMASLGVSITPEKYVYTIGYFPIYSKYVNLELINANNSKDIVKFNLITKDTYWYGDGSSPIYINSRAFINDLSNGWYMLSISFDCTDSPNLLQRIRILPCVAPTNYEEFGSPIVTKSAGRIDCALWQHQLEKGIIQSTPIFTDNTPVTKPSDKVSIPFNDMFSQIAGTISVKVISPNSLINTNSQGVYPLYCFFNTNNSVANCYSTIIDDIMEIKTLNKLGATLETMDSGHYGTASYFNKQSVLSYTDGLHSFGFTKVAPKIKAVGSNDPLPDDIDNNPLLARLDDQIYQDPSKMIKAACNILYLGFNPLLNDYLDSYLINFHYYPLFSSRANIEYLLQEHFE